jgi:hypothetical protein
LLNFKPFLIDCTGCPGKTGLAVQLPIDRLADQVLVVGRNACDDTPAVQRRGGQRADVPQAQHRHVQRSRNGRGGHRQDVHVDPHPLEPLLVLDAEPLFLVDDQQAQVLEGHVAAEEPVCADQDVHVAFAGALQNVFRLPAGLETIEDLDRHRKVGKPLAERAAVLDRQHRRRDQHGDLLAMLDRLERRPHRQFGLAVPTSPHKSRSMAWLPACRLDPADGADPVKSLVRNDSSNSICQFDPRHRGCPDRLPLGLDLQ